MQRIKYWIRNYFGFSEIETKGFIIILIFMLFLLIFPSLLKFVLPRPVLNNQNQKVLNKLLADIDSTAFLQKFKPSFQKSKPSFQEKRQTYTLSYFDPNTASKSELVALGLKAYVVKNILKYRSKGGFFKHKEKFSLVYGLSKEKYEELAPYIVIKHESKKQSKRNVYTLFNFDPNTASKSELLALGLKTYVVKNILKYRNKGGFFKHKEKFSLVYGLSEEKYKELEPYISIAQKEKKTQKERYTTSSIKTFDINKAEVSQLKQVNGIGDYYANKIIKFRNALGGFYTKDQIRETYNLPKEAADELLKHISLDKENIQKIDLNKVDAKVLAKHPYIKWNLAKVIVSYRLQHGNFKTIEELKNIKIINKDTFNKIKSYFKL